MSNTQKKAFRALVFISLFAAMSSATQYFAYLLNYQHQLGKNYQHVYLPWMIFKWWSAWYPVLTHSLELSASIGLGVGSVLMICLLFFSSFANSKIKANAKMHGSARWAEQKDIKQMGLLGNYDGVYVGGWVDSSGYLHYLRHSGSEHVFTCAPTRSGKGISLIIPTLLSWPYSCIITDMKAELFNLTAGWRKKYAKNKILRFEPSSQSNDCFWNPLNEIRLDKGLDVGDTQNLVSIIVNPDGKSDLDHWEKTASALLTGVILHAIYKGRAEGFEPSLSYVDQILSPASNSVTALWVEMTSYLHKDGKTHTSIASAARDMLDRPEEERGSVLSTAKSFLELYRDPVVARSVSRSSFSINDLANHESPVSLYIVIPPTDKTRMRPLVRVMINSIIRVLANQIEYEKVGVEQSFIKKLFRFAGKFRVKQKKPHKHKLLFMLDEFPSLGRLGIIEDALAHVAAWGMKFYLICQDIRQLQNEKNGYGADETITSNCHITTAFPPNNLETAEHLSKLTGETTVVKEQITTSGRRGAFSDSNVSRNFTEVKRNLLTADECLRLPGAKKKGDIVLEGGDMLISVAGFPVIHGKQPLYFKDDIFSDRAAIDAPLHSDVLRNSAAQHQDELCNVA